MGNCTSHGFGSIPMAAKLILVDGQLEEFSHPVKVSQVPRTNLDCFICNSDDMEFDGIVTAMDGDDPLLPGQLYFELPLSFLTQRLQPEDMASLAVKASLALSTRTHHHYGCYCHRSPKRVFSVDPLTFLHEENIRVKSRSARSGPAGGGNMTVQGDCCDLRFVRSRTTAARKAGNVKVTKFTATLSAILEIEE